MALRLGRPKAQIRSSLKISHSSLLLQLAPIIRRRRLQELVGMLQQTEALCRLILSVSCFSLSHSRQRKRVAQQLPHRSARALPDKRGANSQKVTKNIKKGDNR